MRDDNDEDDRLQVLPLRQLQSSECVVSFLFFNQGTDSEPCRSTGETKADRDVPAGLT